MHGLSPATLAAGAAAATLLLPPLLAASPLGPRYNEANHRFGERAVFQGNTSNADTWSWTSGPKMHGVALGNWLVLERWMDEEWFVTTCGNASAQDEWTFSQLLGDNATAVLTEHWNTWITDADIKTIAESGFNHIRIPLGYWAFISEPAGTPYASQAGQVEQLTRVLQSADNYGLYAILDMHGLPGSQNGEQESGHVGYNNFFQAGNQNYSDATIDAVLAYVANSTHRHLITALAACNEPVYYNNDQFETLVEFYERTYAKTSAMGLPLMFHPGHPTVSPQALFQSFVNGKNPALLIMEQHPYPGRLTPFTSDSALVGQVCSDAATYASYDVPVAITEWAVSTDKWNDTAWDAQFFAAQATGWAQAAGGIFWSYKTIAYTALFNQTENFTLYSFIDLANDGIVPLPSAGETSQQYLAGLTNPCSNSSSTTKVYGTVVPSVSPSVTAAFSSSAAAATATSTSS